MLLSTSSRGLVHSFLIVIPAYNCWVHSVNMTEDGPKVVEPPDASSPTMDACPRCHIITKNGISVSLEMVVLVRVPFSLLADIIYLLLASAALDHKPSGSLASCLGAPVKSVAQLLTERLVGVLHVDAEERVLPFHNINVAL